MRKVKSGCYNVLQLIFTIYLLLLYGVPEAQEIKPTFQIGERAAKATYPVSDLNFHSSNKAQFQRLKEAIGSKRVVLLGEQTHGDGTTFQAKALITRFLFEEMGFNVLAFESSFYEAFKANEELMQGRGYEEIIPKGIASRWSGVVQTQPLFSYIQKAMDSDIQLKVAGIDLLFNEAYSKESLLADFKSFLTASPQAKLDLPTVFLDEAERYISQADYFPSAQVREGFINNLEGIIQQLEKEKSTCEWNTPAFWGQVWRNFKVNLHNNWSRKDGTYSRHVFFSKRDSMMAENINWLLAGNDKIIIWSSVTHNMRDFDHNLLQQMNWSRETKFMGEYLEERIGEEEMFHLTFTGYEGAYADIYQNYQEVKFDRPSDESVEASLNRSGFPFCYFLLDSSWSNTYFKGSFIFNKEYQSNWSKSIDAIFFTKTMMPSAPIKIP
uniref:erythromycin esterase family protein n=1 Tax=Fulvivirga sp. TaxID=1931237 RepID=UPI004049EB30